MPFLGLPFGSDQKGNMARAVSEGYALKLDWNDLNEQNLFDSITSLINEPRYQINSFLREHYDHNVLNLLVT
jgi:glucuronosyltransferase